MRAIRLIFVTVVILGLPTGLKAENVTPDYLV
jgi:hypothetical protein